MESGIIATCVIKKMKKNLKGGNTKFYFDFRKHETKLKNKIFNFMIKDQNDRMVRNLITF